MKPVDVKPSIYVNVKKNSNKGPKFKVDDNLRISNHKNIFAEGYVSDWSEEVFVTFTKVNNMSFVILTEKKLLERVTKKNCKKQIKKCLKLRK